MLPTPPFNALSSQFSQQIVPAKRKRSANNAQSSALTNTFSQPVLANANVINNNNGNSNNNNIYRGQQNYELHHRPGLSPSLTFTPPPPASPYSLVDAGGTTTASVSEDIKCICGFSDDDGFTIACDDCGRWSHISCFGFSSNNVPDEWRCVDCFPRLVDAQAARDLQVRRRNMMAASFSVRGDSTPLNVPATANKKRKERRVSAVPMSQSASGSGHGHSQGHGQGQGHPDTHTSVHDNEHIDIEDEWRSSYVPITEDEIPGDATREKLRLVARNWRGVTALADDFDVDSGSRAGSSGPITKVVPVPGQKNDVLPTSFALQTTTPIPGESLIAPFPSTIIPSASYLTDPLNGYAQLGMPKPYVHLVPPPISVALDARMTGNEARFVRSGCRPNAVLRPVLCPSRHSRKSQSNGEHQESDDPGVLKFAIFALRDLKACEEVVLGWEWDDGAVVHQLPALIEEGSHAGPSKLTPHHVQRLRLQMQTIVESLRSNFVTCACGNSARDCAIRLMEEFANDEQALFGGRGAFRNKLYPNGNGVDRSQPTFDSRSATGTPLPDRSPINKHPNSLSSLHELTRNMRAKEKAHAVSRGRDLGPLVGSQRGFSTRVTGGAHEGGLRGVEMTDGDIWDRYGVLEREEQRSSLALPSKLNRKGKGKATTPGESVTINGASLHRSEGSSSVGMVDNTNVTIREDKMPPKMRKRWMHAKHVTLKPDTSTSERNGVVNGNIVPSPDPTIDESSATEGSRQQGSRQLEPALVFMPNGNMTERSDLSGQDLHSNISTPQPNVFLIDTQSMPPPSLAPERRSTPGAITAACTNSNQPPPSTEAPRRPSSLFSLLNEHPVSPLMASKRLEAFPSVKSHVPVSDTPVQVPNNDHVLTQTVPSPSPPPTLPPPSISETSHPPQASDYSRTPTPFSEPTPDNGEVRVDEIEIPSEDEQEVSVVQESRVSSRDTIWTEKENIQIDSTLSRKCSPSPILDVNSMNSPLADTSMRDETPLEVPVVAQEPLESPVMLFHEELMEEDARRQAASIESPVDNKEATVEVTVSPSPALTESPLHARDEVISPTRSPLNITSEMKAIDEAMDVSVDNINIDNDVDMATADVVVEVNKDSYDSGEDGEGNERSSSVVIAMDAEPEFRMSVDRIDGKVGNVSETQNDQDESTQVEVDIRVQTPSPSPLKRDPSPSDIKFSIPEEEPDEPEFVTINESEDTLSVTVPEKASSPNGEPEKTGELVVNVSDGDRDEKSIAPLIVQRDVSPAFSIASSIERQTTPGVPPSSGDVAANSLLTKVNTLNLGFDQKERDNSDASPTTLTPAPQEPQKIRRTMAAYKERKKRQREEEAAKAAVTSPITPAAQFSPIFSALDTEASKVDKPPDEIQTNLSTEPSSPKPNMQDGNDVKDNLPVLPSQDNLVPREIGGKDPGLQIEIVPTPVAVSSPLRSPAPSQRPDLMEERVDFSPTPEPEFKPQDVLMVQANHDNAPLLADNLKQPPTLAPTTRPSKEEGEIGSSPILAKTKPLNNSTSNQLIQPQVTYRERAQTISTSRPQSTVSSSNHSPNIDQSRYRANSRGHTPPRQPRALREPPPQSHRFQSPTAPGSSSYLISEEKKLVGRIQRDRPPPAQPAPPLSMRISSAPVPVKELPPNKPLSAGANPSMSLLSRMPLPPKHDHIAGQPGNDPRSGVLSSGRSNPPVAPRNMMIAQSRGQQPPRGPHALNQRDMPRERGRDYIRDRDREHYSPPRGRQSARGRSWSRAGR